MRTGPGSLREKSPKNKIESRPNEARPVGMVEFSGIVFPHPNAPRTIWKPLPRLPAPLPGALFCCCLASQVSDWDCFFTPPSVTFASLLLSCRRTGGNRHQVVLHKRLGWRPLPQFLTSIRPVLWRNLPFVLPPVLFIVLDARVYFMRLMDVGGGDHRLSYRGRRVWAPPRFRGRSILVRIVVAGLAFGFIPPCFTGVIHDRPNSSFFRVPGKLLDFVQIYGRALDFSHFEILSIFPVYRVLYCGYYFRNGMKRDCVLLWLVWCCFTWSGLKNEARYEWSKFHCTLLWVRRWSWRERSFNLVIFSAPQNDWRESRYGFIYISNPLVFSAIIILAPFDKSRVNVTWDWLKYCDIQLFLSVWWFSKESCGDGETSKGNNNSCLYFQGGCHSFCWFSGKHGRIYL